MNLPKLMVIEEDDELQIYRYRIACQCGDEGHDIHFDIYSDTIDIDGIPQIFSWQIEMACYPDYSFHSRWNWFSRVHIFWQRLQFAVKLLFASYPVVHYEFLLDDKNVQAFHYVLNKFEKLQADTYFNEYDKYLRNHINPRRLVAIAYQDVPVSEKEDVHFKECSVCSSYCNLLKLEKDFKNVSVIEENRSEN